ncbi:oligosaccharide flippase family protein [Pleurocapsa sp. FMAR1]|uniref:oligosaccharide flippase family protein n=1 Tax=Pleurocapsa sp. FMAR1 TaxID=3040204 RepID=UPI0029C895C2|nr:oligosaccharide flippase family protein [Pleurocapsa sp. FMAR1]
MFKEKFSLILSNLLQNKLFKNTWTIFQSFILRLVIQGFYFVILARTFAPEKYGAYVGIVAIVSIFIPFAGWGSGEVFIQNVARDRSLFREYFGATILKTLLFSSIFTALILIAYNFFSIPNISIYSVFFVTLANLTFLKFNDIARDAFMAVGLLNYTAKTIVLMSLNRFVAVLVFIAFFDQPSILTWCILYCVATFVSGAASIYLVIKLVGYPKFNLSRVKQELRLGFAFAVSVSAQNIYNDLDKSMLAKLSTLEATGIYGAAYHILNVALTPIQSVALASFRKFFQHGASGIKGSFELCKKLLPLSLAYSLLAVVGLVVLAPLLPIILGSQYQASARALIWLSPTIFLRTMHFFAADTLTGANYQSSRTTAQVLVAIINGLLNFWLIPKYGWLGAIWATIASEFLLMVFLWGFVYRYSKQSASNI